MLDKEIEDHINFVKSLNLTRKDFFEYVMNNFSEEELRNYKENLYQQTIQNFQKAGIRECIKNLEELNAFYENNRIYRKGLKNTFLDN